MTSPVIALLVACLAKELFSLRFSQLPGHLASCDLHEIHRSRTKPRSDPSPETTLSSAPPLTNATPFG